MLTTIFSIRGTWWTFVYLRFSFSAGTHFVDVFLVKSGFHVLVPDFAGAFVQSGQAPGAAPRLAARASKSSACITLEMWIVPSRSTIAPWGCCWLLRMWRLIMLHAFDDDALLLAVSTAMTLAALALLGAGDHHHLVASS